jgi:hypothetical protein
MIKDLFSHKIHSSGDDWPEKLAELAAVFGEFDNQVFDRSAFEERLARISPRASYLAKDAAATTKAKGGRLDVSKFRDEISAYPAYLGLYFLEQSTAGWVVKVSETAKRFLLREEPDVASFLRLQLPLFQYPNAMGASYASFTNKLRLQANTRDRALEFIKQGVHFSPVRLIAVALKADAELRAVHVLNASVTFAEIYGLANLPQVNQVARPSTEAVRAGLDDLRRGKISSPKKFESRFHTLRHTEIFMIAHKAVQLRNSVNEADRSQLVRQLDAICSITSQFNGFDLCTSAHDIEKVIASGEWGKYFDSVRTLPSDIVEALSSDKAIEAATPLEPAAAGEAAIVPQPVAEIYPFRERTGLPPDVKPYNRRREMADPELTRIKMQRRNLAHKELIDKMDSWLRELGATPTENDHIDLFAKVPGDGSFIFEMKSGGESILDQIRKGLSQLYEYRYRYRDIVDDSVSLCLVLPEDPKAIPWVTEYLCEDRQINICWFEESGELIWPPFCDRNMGVLMRRQGLLNA